VASLFYFFVKSKTKKYNNDNHIIMALITSKHEKKLYEVVMKSPSGNTLIADEPEDNGGGNLGFSPKELLLSSLAACTSATVRMYANRKQWDLQEVLLTVSMVNESNGTTISRKIEFKGDLTSEQRDRLLAIANACPIHKILSNTIQIETTLT
jgi:putative redox protein